jgi:lipoyl(octanoyl) transferase
MGRSGNLSISEAWLWNPGVMPYGTAYQVMHELAARRAAGQIPDVLLLLEHPPVYTAGRRTDPSHLRLAQADMERNGAEFHHVDRGGSVTFHGPGQLVGYPIVHLGPVPDVVRYLRDIEEVIIRASADLGITVGRNRDTGVWAADRKVCAIGVRVSRAVTLHGFALNCSTDLSWYDAIVPCGLSDRSVTTLSHLAGHEVTPTEALPPVVRRFEEVFERRLVPASIDLAGTVLPPDRVSSPV